MELLVVGTVALDDVETPKGSVRDVLGGSATYFSYAASFFAKVHLVGAVGDDFPKEHLELLGSRGIDHSGVAMIEGMKTFHWSGKYQGAMNAAETLDTRLNVLENYRPVLPEALKSTPYVFLANGEPVLQLSVLDQLDGNELVVSDTMNLWIDTAPDLLKQVLQRVNGLVINEDEALMLTGRSNILAAAGAILDLGPEFVMIKRGEYGSYLRCGAGQFAIPAYPVPAVVDPTGAGDSFAGGMMGSLAASGATDFASLKKAMAYGTVTASFNVEEFSLGRFQQIERADLDKRFKEFVEYVAF